GRARAGTASYPTRCGPCADRYGTRRRRGCQWRHRGGRAHGGGGGGGRGGCRRRGRRRRGWAWGRVLGGGATVTVPPRARGGDSGRRNDTELATGAEATTSRPRCFEPSSPTAEDGLGRSSLADEFSRVLRLPSRPVHPFDASSHWRSRTPPIARTTRW